MRFSKFRLPLYLDRKISQSVESTSAVPCKSGYLGNWSFGRTGTGLVGLSFWGLLKRTSRLSSFSARVWTFFATLPARWRKRWGRVCSWGRAAFPWQCRRIRSRTLCRWWYLVPRRRSLCKDRWLRLFWPSSWYSRRDRCTVSRLFLCRRRRPNCRQNNCHDNPNALGGVSHRVRA